MSQGQKVPFLYEYNSDRNEQEPMAIWVLLAIYGIGCEIISGICPLNENRQDEDIITKIHGGSSAIGFMALLVVPLLLALLQQQSTKAKLIQ